MEPLRFRPRPVLAVDQQNVLPVIVVVVQKGSSRAHGFGKVLFPEGAVVVFKAQAGLPGDVSELHREGFGIAAGLQTSLPAEQA